MRGSWLKYWDRIPLEFAELSAGSSQAPGGQRVRQLLTWGRPPGLDHGRLIALGIGWAVATVLFEFGFGH